MKNASGVLIIYLISLLVISLVLSWLGYSKYVIPMMQNKILLTPMVLFAIIGGFISLWNTISHSSFRIFLIVYCSLWALRLSLLFIGNQIGQTNFWNKQLHIDFIISNYYSTVSRLDTPLPFILYWFINYFFKVHGAKKEDPASN